MAEKSCGYRPGLFLVLGLAFSSFSYSKCSACSNDQKKAAGLALGGSCEWWISSKEGSSLEGSVRRMFGDKLEWGASRGLFPSGRLSIRREVLEAVGRALVCGGATRGLLHAGKPHRYMKKMGLDQNLLDSRGADFHSGFFFLCVVWWLWFFSLIKSQVNVSHVWSWPISAFLLHPCMSAKLEEECQPCIVLYFKKWSQF